MVINPVVVQGGARAKGFGVWGFVKFFFKYGIMILIVSVILINAIAKGVEENSFEVFYKEIANRFLLVSENINTYSQKIINNETSGKIESSKNVYNLFSSLLIFFAWMKVLSFLFARTPLSNTSNWFINYTLAFAVFYFGQLIFGAFFTEESFMYHVKLPIFSLWYAGKAFLIEISPITQRFVNLFGRLS